MSSTPLTSTVPESYGAGNQPNDDLFPDFPRCLPPTSADFKAKDTLDAALREAKKLPHLCATLDMTPHDKPGQGSEGQKTLSLIPVSKKNSKALLKAISKIADINTRQQATENENDSKTHPPANTSLIFQYGTISQKHLIDSKRCGKETILKYLEGFVATVPEGLTAAFLALRQSKNLWTLTLAIPATLPLFVQELAWMGSAIEQSGDAIVSGHAVRTPWPKTKQIALALAPTVYTAAVIQAAAAVGMHPTGIAIVAIAQYTLQLMKSCFAYNEYAEANNLPGLKQAPWLKIQLQFFNLFGIPTMATKTWTAMEWYIHQRAVVEFSKVLSQLFSENTGKTFKKWIGNSIVSTLMGAAQTPFTSSFDIPRFENLLKYLQKQVDSPAIWEGNWRYVGKPLGFVQDCLGTFSLHFFGNEVLQGIISGTYINYAKTFLMGAGATLIIDLGLKTAIGYMIGAVGGLTAASELFDAKSSLSLSDLQWGLCPGLGIGYAAVNFIQGGYGKYPDTKWCLETQHPKAFWQKKKAKAKEPDLISTPIDINESDSKSSPDNSDNSDHDSDVERKTMQTLTESRGGWCKRMLLQAAKYAICETIGIAKMIALGVIIDGTAGGLVDVAMDHAGMDSDSGLQTAAMGAIVSNVLGLFSYSALQTFYDIKGRWWDDNNAAEDTGFTSLSSSE